ncbi:MAG TPA: hypothetical protein VJY62_16610, partial [Bacteroidia bacterium]|nr:hypothetical protein [Bacteroidia bacterium]
MKKHLKQKRSQRIVHRINFKTILYVTTVSSVVITSFIILQEAGIHTTSKAEKEITVSYSSAKDVPFEKENFREQQKTFEAVKINIEKGLELLDNDPPLYEDALNLFLEAQEFNPNSSDLNYKIGICYMNSGTKFEALDYFEKAFALNNKVDPKVHYYLGEANQIQHHFTKAKEEYEKYIKEVAKDKSEIEISNKRISECVTGDFLITHPVKVKIENLGEGVNTQYPEYSPHI